MVQQKKTGLVCHECQCPPCLKCGKRADDADSVAFRMQDSYYCEECKKDHKLKQCKKCGEFKSLSCYPENVRKSYEKFKHIMHKHHWCTECIESKEKQKVDWVNACIAQDKRKQCAKCEAMKSLSCYPENVRTMCERRRNIDHKRHWCTECLESKVDWMDKRKKCGKK